MRNILGLILVLMVGLALGNFSKSNLVLGIGLLFLGSLLTFIFFYLYRGKGILSDSNKGKRLILLIVCIEVVGFILGFTGLINFSVFTFDVIIIVFLVFLILVVFLKELIKIFKNRKTRKHNF